MQEDESTQDDNFELVLEPEQGDTQSQQVEQETTPAESSTEENKETEQAETTEETESTESEDSGDTTDEETEETTEDKPKAKNNAQDRIRGLVSEKRALQKEVERLTAMAYQPKTAQQLQEEGMDETAAQVEALRQENAVKDYTSHVVELTNDLNMESLQVMQDFPVFNPNSPEYDKDFAEEVGQKYLHMSGIETDPRTGNIVKANVLPYEYYETMANVHSRGLTKGQISGKKAAEKQLASTETTGNQTLKKEQTDPVMDVLLKGLDD
jgi:hypothetical protein